MKAITVTISRNGPRTQKVHGYTIDFHDGPAYHILPYKEDTQEKVDDRFIRVLNDLIEENKL